MICKFICGCSFISCKKKNSNEPDVLSNDSVTDTNLEITNIDHDMLDKFTLTINASTSQIITHDVLNPLHCNLNKKNEKIYKFTDQDLINWECPICFESIILSDKINNVCIPFQCNHLTCYDCFVNCINYKLNKSDIQNLNCSLCRSKLLVPWKNSNKIGKKKINVDKLKFYYSYPVC